MLSINLMNSGLKTIIFLTIKYSSYVKYHLSCVVILYRKYNSALGCIKLFQILPLYNNFIEKPDIKEII